MPIIGTGASHGMSARFKSVVSGGVLTNDGTYYYRTFTGNGTLQISDAALTSDVLLVAGGGAGGFQYGGGGGAGGLVYSSQALAPGTYSIVIGAGASAQTSIGRSNGSNSTMTGITTAIGGGGGGSESSAQGSGAAGGSGGGANANYIGTGGAATSGQGNSGGATQEVPYSGYSGNPNSGGGGGGAGARPYFWDNPGRGGPGGAGLTYFGTAYAGGGGASTYTNTNLGPDNLRSPGGIGGGGGGGNTQNGYYNGPTAGAANRGGGGGGGSISTNPTVSQRYGAAGGSGICVVRYLMTAV